ncbi:MAG: SDR family oxidoreductase [Acidobacteriaceae bacterium]|nr:SDR family oxidoreductase [Acidobacteriaceae bacterium]
MCSPPPFRCRKNDLLSGIPTLEKELIMDQYTGKIALVTGAGRGIGRAIAERLAAEGALVVINYVRDATAAAEAVATIKKDGGDAFALQADVGRVSEVEALFRALDAEFARRGREPGLDILINNAGTGSFSSIAEADEAAFNRTFDTNVKGALFVTRTALERMNAGGRIVMISSIAATMPWPGLALYAASKAALNALTTAVALEAGARGITVNAVAPGWTATDLNRDLRSDGKIADAIAAKTVLGRWGTVSDIAAVVTFLASPDAAWVTGQIIEASGGFGLGQ